MNGEQEKETGRAPDKPAEHNPMPTNDIPTTDRWYLAKEKKKLGPYSAGELRLMVNRQSIQPSDMLLKVGASRWEPAGGLIWLFAPVVSAGELPVASLAPSFASGSEVASLGGVSTGPYHPEQEDTTTVGPYKLLQKLGEGGMGVVWMAEQREPVHRYVALKIIRSDLQGSQVLARFEAERQALAMMDHPSIARVLDAGATSTGGPYFVMELVKGIPFAEFCDQEKLRLQERLELFIPVCNAVQHAHQKGIIHRDLKPSNVLVALYDGKPVPKVIDFGLAKATHQKLTEKTMFTAIGRLMGTLEYMAPEQAELNNLDIDTRADIYSLGIMLYELLTGAPPFTSKQLRGAAFTETLRMIREVEPSKPSTKLSSSEELSAVAAKRKLDPKSLARLVRGDLDWIVMKCLEKERSRRYETANQLGEELQRFLKDEPVQAGPPSAAYRAKKFIRRNQVGVIAAACVALVLVLGFIGTSIGLVAAEYARAAETKQRELAENAVKAEKKARDEAVNAAAAEKLATKKAIEANALALKRLKQIETAFDLLESIFLDINPRVAKKNGPILLEQLTLRLRETADQLDEAAIGDPLTVARLRNFLGNTLGGMGDTAKAIELHSKARTTREKALGPDHPDTLVSMNNLAAAYQDTGQTAKAIAMYEETLAKKKAILGHDHPNTLITMNNLAVAYQRIEQSVKAIELYEETLEKRKNRLGPSHPDTLMSMANLAVAYYDAGQIDKALPLLEETLTKRKLKLGPDHPDTLVNMNNLAELYREKGQVAKAIRLLKDAVVGQTARLGPLHPETLSSMSNLALAYRDDRQWELAVSLSKEALEKRIAKLGPGHPHTLLSMNNLAAAYHDAGQSAKAIPLFEETLAKRKVLLGPDHPDTLVSMENLALTHLAVNQTGKAMPLLNEVVAAKRQQLGANPPAFAGELSLIAVSLLKHEQHAVAETMLRECLQIYMKSQAAAWTTFDMKAQLGRCLLEQKKYKEATLLLKEGYQGMKQRETTMPASALPRLTEALERLVRCYDAVGNVAEAELWRKELIARRSSQKAANK